MKSLAFLFLASILFLFVGLALTEGQTPPPEAYQTVPAPSPRKKSQGHGSANHASKPIAQAAWPAKSALADALHTDDLCLAAVTVGKNFPVSPAELAGALHAFGAPSNLQELVAEKGPLFGPVVPEKRFSTPFLNLMYALRLAGLVNFPGADLPQKNQALALSILKELESTDSSNGAYPYFQLGIMRELKAKTEDIREVAERVARASYFDAMVTSQLAELEGSRWQSPTHFYVLDWISTQLRSISYYSSLDALNSLAGEAGGDELKDRIGRLMVQEGQRATRRSQYHGFDGSSYGYGTILTTAEDDVYIETLSDEIAGYPWKYAPYVSRDQGDCKRAEFDAYYEEMRGHP